MGIKKMRIRIGRDGQTTIRVEGGEGDDCLAFTKAVEAALGAVEHRELTEDYHRTVSEEVRIHQGVGEGKRL